jgi:hypothetical protein
LEETSNTDKSLVRKPERKRPLRKPKRRWEDNIKMNLRETDWGMDCISLAQDRDWWRVPMNTVLDHQIP